MSLPRVHLVSSRLLGVLVAFALLGAGSSLSVGLYLLWGGL